jgi:FdrA protein
MSPVTRCLVRPDTYRDSVVLMRVAAEVEQMPGVARAALMMATPANRGLLAEAGLLDGEAVAAGPGDLVIAVTAADARMAGDALASAERLLDRADAAPASAAGTFTAPRTIAEAAALGGANLAMISTPGAYATAEALKALKRGLSVFLFSDNVPIEDEIELKRLAAGKRLLMMGPDCGTAIVDGIPLGFANAVRRGRVGLAGASGTGLQQVSCLIDRLDEGVSQVIGVGSRDLDARVGGLMMRAAIERLAADPATAVIVLVSKPPAARSRGMCWPWPARPASPWW